MAQESLLDELIEAKLRWIAEQRQAGVEGVFKATAVALPLPPSLHDALRVPRAEHSIVAELKRRDPYRAGAESDFDAAEMVRALEDAGVSAVAVCTDEEHYGCSFQDVLAAAQATALPVLVKDLVLDPLQITMARAHGASAVLLNADVVDERQLRALFRYALELGLDVLVEASTALELDAVSKLRFGPSESAGVRIFGVSACDASTGRIDPTRHERLLPAIPEHAVKVAWGGIETLEQVERLEHLGYEAFMVPAWANEDGDALALVKAVAGAPMP